MQHQTPGQVEVCRLCHLLKLKWSALVSSWIFLDWATCPRVQRGRLCWNQVALLGLYECQAYSADVFLSAHAPTWSTLPHMCKTESLKLHSCLAIPLSSGTSENKLPPRLCCHFPHVRIKANKIFLRPLTTFTAKVHCIYWYSSG